MFLHEVKAEINKISWPRQEELIGTTIVVFILVIFFAILLGIMDYSFSLMIKKIFGGRGLLV